MWCLRHIPSITISTSSMRSCILHSTEPSGLYFSFSSLGSKDIYVMCIYRWVLQLSTVKKINNYGFTLNEGSVWHNIFCQHSHLRTYIIYIYCITGEPPPQPFPSCRIEVMKHLYRLQFRKSRQMYAVIVIEDTKHPHAFVPR